jgi:hypothetical protein
MLPMASRLLSTDEVEPLLERVESLPSWPLFDACRAEANGLLQGDRERVREAAALYLSIDMPYEAARCLLDVGDVEQARELVERHGFAAGPLGSRLAATSL